MTDRPVPARIRPEAQTPSQESINAAWAAYYQAQAQQPVVTRPAKRTMHGLHAVLTFATCGLWLPVWLLAWILNELHPANRAKVEYR